VYTFYPLRPRQRAVVTVHDAIADRFPDLTLPSARARLFWRIKMRVAIRQATLILSVSDYAADQVADFHGVPRSKLRVAVEAPAKVYHPVDAASAASAAASVGIPTGGQYFTYVGGFSPHKRLDVILRAHASLIADQHFAPHLILIGRLDGDAFLTSRDSLLSLVADLGLAPYVHWTGFLPDETVRALHSGAVGSLLVSESEGFGLPAVEAAACGAPVIATTESPLPHLLEGGGVFVAPGDTVAVAQAMRDLLSRPDEATAMGRRARERASRLSWRGTAEATLRALEEAAA
jgi:glycosyltransferase involved in cell wall biosynthesis